jgi:hypothetical protein
VVGALREDNPGKEPTYLLELCSCSTRDLRHQLGVDALIHHRGDRNITGDGVREQQRELLIQTPPR